MTRPGKIPSQAGTPGSSALEADALTTRPTRRSTKEGNRWTSQKTLRTPRGIEMHW